MLRAVLEGLVRRVRTTVSAGSIWLVRRRFPWLIADKAPLPAWDWIATEKDRKRKPVGAGR